MMTATTKTFPSFVEQISSIDRIAENQPAIRNAVLPGMEPLGLRVSQSLRPLNPISESDHSSRTNNPRRLRNQSRFVGHLAPRVFAPHKMSAVRGQAALTGIGEQEPDSIVQTFLVG